MRRFLLPLLLATLAVSSTPTHAVTIPATEDTCSLKGKTTVATNKATTLTVDGTRHAFVYFDLSEIPAGAQIRYARLRLYFPSVIRAGGGLTLHTVTGQWNEGVASAEPGFDAMPLFTFAPTAVGAKRFVSVDVTDAVKAWLTNPASNEGFALAAVPGATTKLTASATIGSKEGTGNGYPAELDIELVKVPGLITADELAPDLALGGTTSGTFSGNAAGLTALTAANISGQISNAQIGTGAVQQGNIGNGAVGSNQLAPNAVLMGNIANGAVGTNQLASNLTLGGTTSGTFSGNGALLTTLNATNLASGTVPNARLGGTYGNALNLPNTGNTITGAFTASADADFQSNLIKNPALGLILYHPSFANPTVSGIGPVVKGDGMVSVQAANFQEVELVGQPNFPYVLTETLDKPGTFFSAIVRASDNGFQAGNTFVISLGTGGTSPHGFGFKVDEHGVKGFTAGANTTEIDLHTVMLGDNGLGDLRQLNLLAIRRTASVDFYINGVLQGTSTTNLPDAQSIYPLGYVIRAKTTGVNNTITMLVAGMTIGLPMF